ncbi:conserved Plasmodium protein, unknown function [Plasmodium gallinaceum]|uniref:Dynein regulatory complex protein 10 n=1 Tax=Plasmodium gallinaceum TaxID=5849 RepID=A0A1J1GUJ5_PLAGA|nr:conserved Plasmodium protein, unknown function [Plasmodium gallinaceum]CRG96149.1 conserved Plasmodium protein, unknown function [Plasmodium gallinaceum]
MIETKFIDTDAKRLYNVIEIFEKKMISLSLINEEVLEKLNDKEMKTMPEEFLIYFKDIIKLNKLYEHIRIERIEEETEKTNDNENFPFYIEHQELVEKIKKYCFVLCKILKENNNLFEILNLSNDKDNHDFFKFLHIINDLKDIFFIRFQTTAEEKLKRIHSLEELKEEEKKIQDEEKKLNEELERIRKESQNEIKELEDILLNKEKELDYLKKSSEENIKKLLSMIPTNDSSDNLENINILFEKTKNIYENQIKTYQDQEVGLVKKNKLLELDIKNYIDSIDEEIKIMDNEIEKLSNELKKNRIIENDLDTILMRKKREDEENKFLKELTEKRNRIIQREENINNEAAIIIQSYIRAIKQRNLFSDYQKKKRKKKK